MEAEAELERLVVALATALRAAGVVVPVGAVIAFARAIGALAPTEPAGLYWAGRATLICHREDLEAYDAVFAGLFGSLPPPRLPAARPRLVTVAAAGEGAVPGADAAGARLGAYSHSERLWQEDFARYGEREWDEAKLLIDRLRAPLQLRSSRRLKRARRPGRVDLARTVRQALAHDGEALLSSYLVGGERPRRLVFLLDISGSMKPYARAFLRLAHAATAARGPRQVETFVLGTRLTRLTRPLSERDPDEAFEAIGRTAPDWYGGTRLGDGLAAFNSGFGARGVARGAIVVFVSDGWERGDPALLGSEMARLARLAHRVVWVNPHQASPGYEPLAAGMAAALPHVDDFVAGHSLGSLEELIELLGQPARVVAGGRGGSRVASR